MAYTNPWSDIIPAGTAQASTLDDQARQLRLDIRERMNTILATGKKWTDDPIGLDASSFGGVTGRHIIFPSALITPVTPKDDNVRYEFNGGGFFETIAGLGVGLVSICPIRIPIGVTITRLEALVRVKATDITVTFIHKPFGIASSPATLATLTSSTTGTDLILDTGAGGLSHVVDDSEYFIENSSGLVGAYKVYAYRLTVNVPDLGSVV